jgi:hypothetical protein
LEAYTQSLVRNSEHALRRVFFLYKVEPDFADHRWAVQLRFEPRSPTHFIEGAGWYREYLWKKVLGKFEEPYLPPNPRTRKIYDTANWVGYEAVIEVREDVFAWGILLIRATLSWLHGNRQGRDQDQTEERDQACDGLEDLRRHPIVTAKRLPEFHMNRLATSQKSNHSRRPRRRWLRISTIRKRWSSEPKE